MHSIAAHHVGAGDPSPSRCRPYEICSRVSILVIDVPSMGVQASAREKHPWVRLAATFAAARRDRTCALTVRPARSGDYRHRLWRLSHRDQPRRTVAMRPGLSLDAVSRSARHDGPRLLDGSADHARRRTDPARSQDRGRGYRRRISQQDKPLPSAARSSWWSTKTARKIAEIASPPGRALVPLFEHFRTTTNTSAPSSRTARVPLE